jgi:ABC-type phosphate/phosphonate transport system permease subunit
MNRSHLLLWASVLLFAAFVIWLAMTGRLQAIADLFVEGYWNFFENMIKPLRR